MLAIAGTMALSLMGCSTAKVAVASDLAASAEVLPLTGMGLGRSGDFNFAGGEGRFTRGADKLGLFGDFFVRNTGAGTFRFTGSGTTLEGACRYRESEVNVSVVSVKKRPFAYECRLGRNGQQAGELVIEQGRGRAADFGREGRVGFVVLDGVRLDIQSIHRMAGGGLPTPHPLGYRFVDARREVGAVDLNGVNKTVFAPPAGRAREAVFAGSLALSVLWDPATL